MSLTKNIAAVILPCFNEQDYLIKTCNSLGFGLGKGLPEQNIFLVLIDNNSTDNTVQLAKAIQEQSRPNSVFIIHELNQGYVPARHAGCMFMKKIAEQQNIAFNNIFLIQADADSIYGANYINLLLTTAQLFGHNILYQAAVNYPSIFCDEFRGYIELCEEIDALYMSDNFLELIMDDKVSSFWMDDYFFWGGYTREFHEGEEIYAETTRLFLKALVLNASMHFIEDAYAYHSPRKVIQDPLLMFATAGFPRENSWNELWHQQQPSFFDLKEFSLNSMNQGIINAINYRKMHLKALFKLLPAHVNRSLDYPFIPVCEVSQTQKLLETIKCRTKIELTITPGVFIMDVLNF